MYNPRFPSTNISQNTKPISFSDHGSYNNNTFSYEDDPADFGLSGFDYNPMYGDNYTVIQELGQPHSWFTTQAPAVNHEMADFSYGSSSSSHNIPQYGQIEQNVGMKRAKMNGDGQSVVFRTMSEFENLDDGYKWRKYGKKMLKTSTFPRNYYKCSNEGCKVKKRVERDEEDNRYVLTSYEGIHNHESPSIMYSCDTLLSAWTWKPS